MVSSFRKKDVLCEGRLECQFGRIVSTYVYQYISQEVHTTCKTMPAALWALAIL